MHEMILSMDLACLAFGPNMQERKKLQKYIQSNLTVDMTNGLKFS